MKAMLAGNVSPDGVRIAIILNLFIYSQGDIHEPNLRMHGNKPDHVICRQRRYEKYSCTLVNSKIPAIALMCDDKVVCIQPVIGTHDGQISVSKKQVEEMVQGLRSDLG
jgi:hypothetical protein